MISTFHSLCVKILRQEISQLGYPLNFVIYDRGDQESAARTALRDVRIGEAALAARRFDQPHQPLENGRRLPGRSQGPHRHRHRLPRRRRLSQVSSEPQGLRRGGFR